MNIEQAKSIPMTEILERLNVQPVKIRHNDYWYLSPLREERTASFKVNATKNIWYDFGEGKGGDTINFVCAYLESTHETATVHDALRWLDNMSGTNTFRTPQKTSGMQEVNPSLVLKEVTPIKYRLLVHYLQGRGISHSLAETYCKQLRIYNTATKKNFFALGFPNEEEGYEMRNPFFKSCLGAKTISFIRGADTKQKGIHIFEGSFDFLSALAVRNKHHLNDDAIVLNSTSCVRYAFPYIKNYGYRVAYTWMDNDTAGQKARKALAEFLSSEQDLQHKPMNRVYHPHKDINAWHMHKLGLEG